MNPDSLTEEDKNKLVEFLNMVAENAKFEFDTKEIIRYYGLLSFMQQVMLKKIDANIFEVKEIVEPEEVDNGEE